MRLSGCQCHGSTYLKKFVVEGVKAGELAQSCSFAAAYLKKHIVGGTIQRLSGAQPMVTVNRNLSPLSILRLYREPIGVTFGRWSRRDKMWGDKTAKDMHIHIAAMRVRGLENAMDD